MFPFILFIMMLYPALLYAIDRDYEFLIISCCGFALLLLWLIAFIYDLKEESGNDSLKEYEVRIPAITLQFEAKDKKDAIKKAKENLKEA